MSRKRELDKWTEHELYCSVKNLFSTMNRLIDNTLVYTVKSRTEINWIIKRWHYPFSLPWKMCLLTEKADVIPSNVFYVIFFLQRMWRHKSNTDKTGSLFQENSLWSFPHIPSSLSHFVHQKRTLSEYLSSKEPLE